MQPPTKVRLPAEWPVIPGAGLCVQVCVSAGR